MYKKKNMIFGDLLMIRKYAIFVFPVIEKVS